jgi:hypothetical protein
LLGAFYVQKHVTNANRRHDIFPGICSANCCHIFHSKRHHLVVPPRAIHLMDTIDFFRNQYHYIMEKPPMNELDQEKHNVVVRQCCDLIDEKRVLEESLKQARATTQNYSIAMDEILKLKNAICEVMYYLQHMDPTQNINGHISYMHNLLSISLAPNANDNRAGEARSGSSPCWADL